MGYFDGQTAIVTGGAAGLGKHYAIALAREGCNIVLCDVRPEAEQVAEELRAYDVRATGHVADVSVADDVRRVVDQAISDHGRIDILINNAGIWRGSTAKDDLDKSLDDYEKLIGTNLKGTFMFGRALIPHMIEKGGGNIINIATDHVHTHPGRPTSGGAVMDLYDVSKWGVLGLTLSWASALKAHNIRVNSFSMGATDSSMIRGFFDFKPPADQVATWMSPEAVCDLAIQMLKEGPQGRTGENIGVWVGFEIQLKSIPDAKPATAA